MTYSDSVKKELVGLLVKNACCRRALAAGIVFGAAGTAEKFTINSGSGETSDFIAKTIRDRFKIEVARVPVPKGSRKERLTFSPGRETAPLLEGDISGEIKCHSCLAAFLRGVFISSATISNPRSPSYHAEFVLPDAARAKVVFELLTSIGYTPGIINRKSGTGLYFKNSEKIEELLILLGAKGAAFRMMNCKIEKTIRNAENRATNCVAQNIARTVTASRRQVDDILKLIENGRLEALPYDVRVTAKLRLENPEASLAELAALHKPKISKSGLNHRLQKIAAEAEKE